jgi:hypothetical protein
MISLDIDSVGVLVLCAKVFLLRVSFTIALVLASSAQILLYHNTRSINGSIVPDSTTPTRGIATRGNDQVYDKVQRGGVDV